MTPPSGRSRGGAGPYVVATAICAAVFALDLLFHEPLSETGFLTFFPVVFLAAWWGGRGPGLFATALGTLAGEYLFQAPAFSLSVASWKDLLEVTLFAITGVVIALLAGQLHAALEDAEELEAVALERQRQLDTILSSVADGIAAMDASGRILFANDALAKLFGMQSAQECIGLRLRDLFQRVTVEDEAGQYQSWSELPFERALATGSAVQAVIRVKNPDESDHWVVVVSKQPVIGPAGQMEMMIVAMADISSIQRAEQERDSWMQALAHDLKSPLTAALVSAQLGLRHLTYGNTTAARAALEHVVQNTGRLSGMIKQLSDLTRQRTHGTLDLRVEPCDIVALAACSCAGDR